MQHHQTTENVMCLDRGREGGGTGRGGRREKKGNRKTEWGTGKGRSEWRTHGYKWKMD